MKKIYNVIMKKAKHIIIEKIFIVQSPNKKYMLR